MENQGKLYIFMGASGTGKDFALDKFMDYCRKEKREIQKIIKHFTRPARDGEVNNSNYFGVSRERILQDPNIVSARINGELIGIDIQDTKDKLNRGINIALPTGSFDLVYELAKTIPEQNLKLIYICGTNFNSLRDYLKLASERRQESDVSKFTADYHIRYLQQCYIYSYFNSNKDIFDYIYTNMSRGLSESAKGKYDNIFFDDFFKAIFDENYEYTLSWYNTNEGKKSEPLKNFILNYEKQNFDFEDIMKDIADEINIWDGYDNLKVVALSLILNDYTLQQENHILQPDEQQPKNKEEKHDELMPNEELQDLYKRIPLLEKYMNDEFKSQNIFSGTKRDRILCLFIAGIISKEDIGILTKSGIISGGDFFDLVEDFINQSPEIMNKLSEVKKSALKKLSLPEVKDAFANPLDEGSDRTVYDKLGDLVSKGIITPSEFGALSELNLIPVRMIHPLSRKKFKEDGIIVYPILSRRNNTKPDRPEGPGGDEGGR